MTLRGGGKTKQVTKTTHTPHSAAMSAKHREALDKIVKDGMKKEKKKELRKMARKLRRQLRRDGVAIPDSDSDSYSSDSSDSSDSSREGKKKKKKRKKKKSANRVASEDTEKARLQAEIDAHKMSAKATADELLELKELVQKQSSASKGSLDNDQIIARLTAIEGKVVTPAKGKPKAIDAPPSDQSLKVGPAKRGTAFDFFAECTPEGYQKNEARSREIWENITTPLEELKDSGADLSTASVCQKAEEKCKKVATALCDTHLASIPYPEATAFFKKMELDNKTLGGGTRSKKNLVQVLLRVMAANEIPCNGDTVGLDEDLIPY